MHPKIHSKNKGGARRPLYIANRGKALTKQVPTYQLNHSKLSNDEETPQLKGQVKKQPGMSSQYDNWQTHNILHAIFQRFELRWSHSIQTFHLMKCLYARCWLLPTEKRYMDSAQTLYKSELSHDNVRNSVCSDWLSEASPEHNDWGGDNASR